MKYRTRKAVIAGVLVAVTSLVEIAAAAEIGFAPALQNASAGDRIALDITVAGLGDGTSPSLGAFDIDVLFDAGALDFVSYSIGGELGFSADASDTSGAASGLIDLAASSLELSSALIGGQGERVLVAALAFDVVDLPTGSSTFVRIDETDAFLALSDENYQPLTIDAVSAAHIRNPPTGAPAPGSAALLLGGWVLLGRLIHAGRRRQGLHKSG